MSLFSMHGVEPLDRSPCRWRDAAQEIRDVCSPCSSMASPTLSSRARAQPLASYGGLRKACLHIARIKRGPFSWVLCEPKSNLSGCVYVNNDDKSSRL